MAGKQAKLLTDRAIGRLLNHVSSHRHSDRDRVLVLLSLKAGLRAGEIANLRWGMVLDPDGKINSVIELYDAAAKKCSGRTIPIHPDLKKSLIKLANRSDCSGPVIKSERGGHLNPNSIVNWFKKVYADLGLDGCSSHSGRRTFITTAARKVHQAGGSLRDVQQLAGHRSLNMTQGYIEGDTDAKRKLVSLL